MENRTRSTSSRIGGGVFKYVSQRTGETTYRNESWGMSRFKTISDYTKKERDYNGLLPSSDCLIQETRVKPMIVSGRYQPDNIFIDARYADGVIPSWFTTIGHGSPSSTHLAKDQGNSVYTNALLARSNPFKPEFSTTVFVREIFDIATMFKLAGSSLLSLAGSTYLNYKFGWEAFLRDLKTLSNLTKAIAKRLDDISRLTSDGGLRRSAWIDRYSTKIPREYIQVDSAQTGQEAYVEGVEQTEVYGSVRWFPAPGAWRILDDLSELEKRALMLRVTLDLYSIEWDTIWQSLPFSWLFDYFYDLGSYFAATRGYDLAAPDYACIIRKTKRTHKYYPIKGDTPASSWRYATTGQQITEVYDRQVVSPSVSVPTGLVLLKPNQALILAALIASFSKGYR
jgi:hypothetical protein